MTLRRLLPIALVLVTVGCATSSDMKKLQDQIVDLQDQVADLKRRASSKEEVEKLNESLASQSDRLLKSNADLSVKVGEMEDRLQNVQGNVEQTNYRVDRLAQQLAQNQTDIAQLKSLHPVGPGTAPGMAPGAGPVTRPGAGAPTTPGTGSAGTPATTSTGEAIRDEVTVQPPQSTLQDPLEVYQTAYRDLQRGNYDLARQGFQDFLQATPSSDLSDNAAYWIGETYFAQKKYKEAIQQFDRVINEYPRSDKVPAALLKKGYAYIESGQKAEGVVQLQYVIHEHPSSNEASLAKQKLKALGIDVK
ncbi:MAG: tol-pal system protein YbgF [Thermoanaerobaculia bacterium]